MDARHQFTDFKGFYEIVIGSHFQTSDFIERFTLRC
jgi:hypothetical protein